MEKLLDFNNYLDDEILEEGYKEEREFSDKYISNLIDKLEYAIPRGKFKNSLGQKIIKVEYENNIYEVVKSDDSIVLKINRMTKIKPSKDIGKKLYGVFLKINK